MTIRRGTFREDQLRVVPTIPVETCLTHILAAIIGAREDGDGARLVEIESGLREVLVYMRGDA